MNSIYVEYDENCDISDSLGNMSNYSPTNSNNNNNNNNNNNKIDRPQKSFLKRKKQKTRAMRSVRKSPFPNNNHENMEVDHETREPLIKNYKNALNPPDYDPNIIPSYHDATKMCFCRIEL